MPMSDPLTSRAAAAWLVADIGASHSRLALATADGPRLRRSRRFRNADHAGLAPLVAGYLAAQQVRVTEICAGVAGPVRRGVCRLTNLDWTIEAHALCDLTGAAHVHLMNDLQAQAHALDALPEASVEPRFAGQPDPDGPRLVMGLGTGSNIALAHRIGDALFVPAAEAGHTGLPHLDAGANAVIAALGQEVAHKPYEALLSGPGLARLHRLRTGVEKSSGEIVTGYGAGHSACVQSLDMFARILGAVLGNLALAHMSTGGIFLIGGLARAIAPHLAGLPFHAAFVARGPYRHILQAMPIHIITDDAAALLGCAQYLRARAI